MEEIYKVYGIHEKDKTTTIKHSHSSNNFTPKTLNSLYDGGRTVLIFIIDPNVSMLSFHDYCIIKFVVARAHVSNKEAFYTLHFTENYSLCRDSLGQPGATVLRGTSDRALE